jgi:hypothetical protein
VRYPQRSACRQTELGLRNNMTAIRLLIFILIAQSIAVSDAQSPNILGAWNVEISFGSEQHRSVHFEAQGEGKGTFVAADPLSKSWGSDKPSEAKWTCGKGNSVTFSGAVELPTGNVGRDAGTLVCRGQFGTPDLITGEVEFSPSVGDRPSKHGTFKATRAH